MNVGVKKLDIFFFQTTAGTEPVRDWFLTLSKDERKIVGDDILKIQYCWPIGKPLVDSLGHGLWEVRSQLGDKIVRIIFCIDNKKMLLLHGFVKKTQKTPQQELELALKRKKQLV